MGLGATLITFSPSTTIKSADINSNLAALNNAASPSFNALTVTGASTLDNGKITTDGNGNLFAVGFQTIRNGVNTPVPTYTGTMTPTSPPTGSIWVKA